MYGFLSKICNVIQPPKISHYVEDLITELAASQLGIAILPKSIYYKQNNPNIRIIPLRSPTPIWELGIITKKDSYHSFALRELLKQLAKGTV